MALDETNYPEAGRAIGGSSVAPETLRFLVDRLTITGRPSNMKGRTTTLGLMRTTGWKRLLFSQSHHGVHTTGSPRWDDRGRECDHS